MDNERLKGGWGAVKTSVLKDGMRSYYFHVGWGLGHDKYASVTLKSCEHILRDLVKNAANCSWLLSQDFDSIKPEVLQEP